MIVGLGRRVKFQKICVTGGTSTNKKYDPEKETSPVDNPISILANPEEQEQGKDDRKRFLVVRFFAAIKPDTFSNRGTGAKDKEKAQLATQTGLQGLLRDLFRLSSHPRSHLHSSLSCSSCLG